MNILREVEKIIRKYRNASGISRSVCKAAYEPYKEIIDLVSRYNWHAEDVEAASKSIKPLVQQSVRILCDFYYIPTPNVYELSDINTHIYSTLYTDTRDKLLFARDHYLSGGSYAGFYGNPYAINSSTILYDIDHLLKGEDSIILVPPFARAMFHEFFHWLTYFKVSTKFRINRKDALDILEGLSSDMFSPGEQAAQTFSYHVLRKAGVIVL